jgi:ParB family chromosome partitioning protein
MNTANDGNVRNIALDKIDVIKNVRKRAGAVAQLAESITRFELLTPVIVRPAAGGRYELVCGQRRLEAVRQAGESHIIAMVKRIEDKDVVLLQLTENCQREEMPLEDFCDAIRELEKQGHKRAAIERRLGLYQNYIYFKMREEGEIEDLVRSGMKRAQAKDLSGADRRLLIANPVRTQDRSIGGICILRYRNGRSVKAICKNKKIMALVLAEIEKVQKQLAKAGTGSKAVG